MKTAIKMLLMIVSYALLTASNEGVGASDYTLPYGAQHRVSVILRVFYTITPTTQLNDVGIGEIDYRFVDVLGTGESKIEGPYEITRHVNLGACDRVGRGPISTRCFNGLTGNAIACRTLVRTTDWEKPGTGHTITTADHDWVRDAIRNKIRDDKALRSIVDTNPPDSWAKPGTYAHSLQVVQPEGTTTVYNVSGDGDKSAAYCIYSVYERK